jgi:hypothetical protein
MPRKRIRKHYRRARYILYRETLIDAKEHILTFVGSFVGIGLIGLLNSQYLIANDNLFLIGSFGASSVLIYGRVLKRLRLMLITFSLLLLYSRSAIVPVKNLRSENAKYLV